MSSVPYLDDIFGNPTAWEGAPFCFTLAIVTGAGSQVNVARGTLTYTPPKPLKEFRESAATFSSSKDTIYWAIGSDSAAGLGLTKDVDGPLSFTITGPTEDTRFYANPYLLSVTFGSIQGPMVCQPTSIECGNFTGVPIANDFAAAIFGAWDDQHEAQYVFTITPSPTNGE
jgi:hypothetical protein